MDTYLSKLTFPEMSGIPSLDYRTLNEGFLVAIGVILAVLASFITCLGLNLQKSSLCAPGNDDLSPWKQPKWAAGFVCVVVGSLIDFLAFGLAPQSLLAPLAALSLVWNLGMASYLLNEKYDRVDVMAVVLIFIGTGITVVFANHKEQEFTLDQLKALYAERRMVAYGIVVPALLAFHYGLIYYVQEKKLTGKKANMMEMVGYAGFAGTVGGQSILFAKSTVELIKDASHGDDVFWHIETYVIIALMTVCLLAQITFLNGGLKRFDSLFVVPVYQSYWIISGVVGGLVYFGEWERFSNKQMVMFIVGTFVTLSGLLVLTQKDHSSSETTPSNSNGYSEVKKAGDDEFGLDEDDIESVGIEVPEIRRTVNRNKKN
uniref:Magnesium transporter n=1 Tax=Mucochytrium quahogii TaxID=96639 RepID=A0A7S2W6H8_9STRA|mmetsp:Transcript_9643/g.15816  ORF Transcript_9643/g.15816 Transcript_9643/m.15816 type:complete len:374 (+) Transcript_9643:166-1287(+)|eukprot:CAMPEP_0203748362 /NCGR_PEP_ID=MMETSP0098-20131031/3272_1 /ASSEMBLY_ACC=CAM_ASM_000208 /TAXON_ID=96639 /ORGANISM=" , Strain NY0313808BC1" /LENGTH=373 /DNA_ID=CAMNT_0050637089 /DNA_START=188 /DNA_END=1309 /DNA_ORIENTATION=-